MNPLLQQFIPEARDLLDQAGSSLLALEREPNATEPMNALFRAIHTLKGTSGLFDIAPLTRVVHAAEDLLDAVQSGQLELAAETADVLLNALDLVGNWIDSLADCGELPDTAEAAALSRVERLRAPLAKPAIAAAAAATVNAGAGVPDWVAAWSPAERLACAGDETGTLLAITYSPDANCFFRGEDPLALMRQIPGLRLLRAEPVAPWPGLEEIDPFICNLRFRAIAAASATEVEHLFHYVPEQVDIRALPIGWASETAGLSVEAGRLYIGCAGLSADDETAFQSVLAGQHRLLDAAGPWRLHLAAAVRALSGALHYTRQEDLAAVLTEAATRAEADDSPQPVLAFIRNRSGQAAEVGAPRAPRDPAPAAAEARSTAPSTLRVEASKIDALMNLIGELVVAKNALAWLARRAEDGSLGVRELAREIKDRQALVNRIAEEMQSAVMAVRMLPVDHVFQRFPRLVRDIARRLGKQVELVVEGGNTEADKNVIEALADPLIHMIRNSLDHGIEAPEARVKAGKPAHGTIRLLALQDTDSVVIRVIDDGRGIDPAAVRRKAIDKGILDAERAAALPDEEAVMLVFAAGFSTAEAVSDLSGRGVGMDVVRSAVEKAGGQVSLTSRQGIGTTVELTLPLSMAVTRIMTVACGDRLFGVPMALVVETVRIPRSGLHRFGGREAFVLRDHVVPLVRLARLLDLPDAGDVVEEAILVVRLNGERLGVVVGAFREDMEVIVKPMDGILANLRGFSGTTLLGDGRVLLILDLRELVV